MILRYLGVTSSSFVGEYLGEYVSIGYLDPEGQCTRKPETVIPELLGQKLLRHRGWSPNLESSSSSLYIMIAKPEP